MKRRREIFGFVLLSLAVPAANAGPRTSKDYAITTESADGGGQRTTSARYSNDGSAGTLAGISTAAARSQTAKSGYAGQLYEITRLALTSAPATVSGTARYRLAAWQVANDATYVAVPGRAVTWKAVAGPIAGIDAVGVATVQEAIHEETLAKVSGSFAGRTGVLSLTLTAATTNDSTASGNDGLPPDWQAKYFGAADASGKSGPNDDFDGTGQTNRFKYVAGLNPTDPNSRFSFAIEPVAGPPARAIIRFSPIVTGRTYTVESSPSLTAPVWQPLTRSTQSDDGNQRTVTDTGAVAGDRFYRVRITKP